MVAPSGMRFSVDPWDPSYGVSLDPVEGQSKQDIDVALELPPERWRPLDPEPGVAPPAAVLFVDGVRRVDAQAWVHDPDGQEAAPALYASYAAGVVCCCARDGAHVASYQVERRLVTTAEGALDVATRAGRYSAVVIAVKANQPPGQALSQKVQGLLNEVEVQAAGRAREQLSVSDDLLVVDGPLRGRDRLPRAVGYVKTHHTPYLKETPAAHRVVAALGPRQRTPLFTMTTPGSNLRRYSWYLRLTCPPGAPWAGIVRLECNGQLALADAVALARRSQITLDRFASTGYKDSRAPQNLYPIAGLERDLRRRLGDAGVLYRALRTAASRPEDPAASRPEDPAASRPGDPAADHGAARVASLPERRLVGPTLADLAG